MIRMRLIPLAVLPLLFAAACGPDQKSVEIAKMLPGDWRCTGTGNVAHEIDGYLDSSVTYKLDGSWAGTDRVRFNGRVQLEVEIASSGQWDVRSGKLWTKTIEAKPMRVATNGRTITDTRVLNQVMETHKKDFLAETTLTFDKITPDLMVYKESKGAPVMCTHLNYRT